MPVYIEAGPRDDLPDPKILKRGELPNPRLLKRPWKLGSLSALPEGELRAWYANMDMGVAWGANNMRLSYLVDGDQFSFNMAPARLYTSNGESRTLRPEHLKLNVKGMAREIIRTIYSKVGGGEKIRVDTGTTERQFLEGLVAKQLEQLAKTGVERHGVFETVLGRMRHGSYGMLSKVTVSLNHINTRPDGELAPRVAYSLVPTEKPKGAVHCEYHIHLNEDDLYPSQMDLLYMSRKRQHSLIIAAKQHDGSFAVVEWKLREGVELKAAMKRHIRVPEDNPFGFLGGKVLKGLLTETFDRRDFVLREEGGRMAFGPLPA